MGKRARKHFGNRITRKWERQLAEVIVRSLPCPSTANFANRMSVRIPEQRDVGDQFSGAQLLPLRHPPDRKPQFVPSPWISLGDEAIRSELILRGPILRIHQNLFKTRTHGKYRLICILDLPEQIAEARQPALGAADVLFQLRRPLD